MPINLPLKSYGPSSAPQRPSNSVGANRAQDFRVSKLQSKVDRDQAAISMNQVLSRKAGLENTRSTSITHLGQVMTGPTTSITHPGAAAGNTGDQTDSGADDRRYDYMRRMIKERQAKAAVEAKKAAAASTKGIAVGTGSALRTTGTGSLHKELGKEFRSNRTKYGSLTSTEKQVLEKSIANRLRSKATGSELTRYDVKGMKSDIKKAHDSGDVSTGHAKILKKVVDKLT